MVNLTFAINCALGGTDVAGYHVVNLAIHILAALALFGIVRRTLDGMNIRPWTNGHGQSAPQSCTGGKRPPSSVAATVRLVVVPVTGLGEALVD